MKARIFPCWGLGLAVAVAAASHGLADGSSPSPRPAAGTAGTASPSPAALPQSSPDAAVAPSQVDLPKPPANAPLSTWALEIQRLARAGVDERVILQYITNSAGLFNLDPDQIIHLKNSGVSSPVLNAMIWHDQNLVAASPPPATDIEPLNILTPLPTAPGEGILTTVSGEGATDLSPPEDNYYAPEQPASTGPVRAPYAVKLSDPILVLRLPTFAVPYW